MILAEFSVDVSDLAVSRRPEAKVERLSHTLTHLYVVQRHAATLTCGKALGGVETQSDGNPAKAVPRGLRQAFELAAPSITTGIPVRA